MTSSSGFYTAGSVLSLTYVRAPCKPVRQERRYSTTNSKSKGTIRWVGQRGFCLLGKSRMFGSRQLSEGTLMLPLKLEYAASTDEHRKLGRGRLLKTPRRAASLCS